MHLWNRKRFMAFLAAFLTAAQVFIVSAQASQPQELSENAAFVTAENYLNIREEDNEHSTIVGRIETNGYVEIVEDDMLEDGWCHIESGDVEGYVPEKYLATGKEAEKIAETESFETATVCTEVLNVRSEADQDASIIKKARENETLKVVEEDGKWVKVELDEDTFGYVSSEYVEVETEYPVAEALDTGIVEYAFQFIGNPYVYGGTSLTNGADCSGFVMSIFAHFGIGLPRTSQAQAGAGTAVSLSELEPGDLVFYYGDLSHVAIYAGNGYIVHAANSRVGITVSDLYYMGAPVCARRVI